MEIIEFTKEESALIAYYASKADASGRTLRIARRGQGLIFKVGGSMWTPTLGKTTDTQGEV